MNWTSGMKAPRAIAAVLLMLVLSPLEASAQVTVRYVHTDAAGSVAALTDENGNVIGESFYDPYGNQLTPPMQDGPAFAGHVHDASTGLNYMQERYYDSNLAVFLSVDPVRAYGGEVSVYHRYRYANSNPYGFKDPDGRQSVRISTAIPDDQLTRSDREAIEAGNRGQRLYEDAVRSSGDSRALESYLNTPVEYRRELSPEAQAIQDANGQSSEGIRAYREPGEAAITILPGIQALVDISLRFPAYHGMILGVGGDATLFQVFGHEHGHVLDATNTSPHDREAAASDHSNRMKQFAPQRIRRELRGR